MRGFALGCSLALSLATGLHAQSFTTSPCEHDDADTRNSSWLSGHPVRFCELRHTVLPLVNWQLRVSGKNGGIEVIGEDCHDIALEARVVAEASSREQAASPAHQVKLLTSGTIEAQGPAMHGLSHQSRYVNYRLQVPRRLAAHLHTENGSIDIAGIEGAIDADTTNGGLTLDNLAGEVHATTVNGGVDVKLHGNQWQGEGLFAKSTNGGVSAKAPAQYSAHLVADTVHGGISVGFPVATRGAIRNHLDTNLSRGGPTVHFQTVNGGVSIDPN